MRLAECVVTRSRGHACRNAHLGFEKTLGTVRAEVTLSDCIVITK